MKRLLWRSLLVAFAALATYVAGPAVAEDKKGTSPPRAAQAGKATAVPGAAQGAEPTVAAAPGRNAPQARAAVVLQLGHVDGCGKGVFSKDGKYILTASDSHEDDTAILWDAATSRQIRAFRHALPIRAIAISPSGQQIVTSDFSDVYFWNAATGKEIRRSPIPAKKGSKQGYCFMIVFSPDGRSVLLDADGLRLWDVATGKEALQFEPHKFMTKCAAFSPDGRWVLTGDYDKTARLWDAATGKESAQLGGHAGIVSAVAFSPDSEQAYTVCDGKVRLWGVASGALTKSSALDNSLSYGDSQSLSPDGKLLLTSGFYLNDNGKELAKLWDTVTGKVLHVFPNTTKGNHGGKAVFSADGKQIYIACDDGTARVWSAEFLAREPLVLEGKTDSIESAAFSSDGTQVLIGSGDGTTRLRDLATGMVARTFQGHVGILSRDGNTVITGPPTDNFDMRPRSAGVNFDQRTKIWATASGKELAGSGTGSPLCVSPNGKKAVFFTRIKLEGQRKGVGGLTRMCLQVWDTVNGTKLQEIPMPLNLSMTGSVIRSATFSADGTCVAFAAWDQGAWLWDFKTTTIRNVGQELALSNGRKTAVAFSPDGKSLLIGGEGQAELVALGDKVQKVGWPNEAVNDQGQRQLFRFGGRADDKILRTFSVGSGGHIQAGGVVLARDMVNAVAFSPDGKQVITGHSDSTARLWSTESGKVVRALSGHEGRQVQFAAFSPDGKKVLTAGSGGEVRLWDAATGFELLKMFNFRDGSWVAVTPGDNYYLASRGRLDGIAFVLGTRPYSFDQFDLKFNRPDKVVSRIGIASPEVVAAYRHAYEKRLKRLNFTDAMLGDDFHIPEVDASSTSPPDSRQRVVTIAVNARDSAYLLDRLHVAVNGVPTHGTAGIDLRKKAAKTHHQDIEVELSPGKNRIEVSVLNEKGAESLKESLTVQCEAPPRKPDLYVVAVGVSDYADARFRLTYADKDARDLATLLEGKRDRFGAVKVLRVLNRDATRENVLKAAEFLKPCRVDDAVVLFFAGHGLLDAKLDYYFATADIDFADPTKRGLPYESIEGLLDGTRARRKLLLMDTCHSGELDKDDVLVAKAEGGPGGPATARAIRSGLTPEAKPKLGLANSSQLLQGMFADLRRGTGAVVVASAGGAEYALESAEWKNGVFTHAVLRGLKGEADRNRDGRVQMSELRDFVEREVKRLTGGRQSPTARSENLLFDFTLD